MFKSCPTCKAQYEGGEVFCPVDASRLVTPSMMPGAKGDSKESDPLVGVLLDRYRIVRRIGEGGMGFVYEAIHTAIEKRVAIKLLRKDFSSKPDVVERFRQEAKSASRIGHAHIVDISDFGETSAGESYFVMEYLEGRDLAHLLAKEGTLPPKRAIDIVIQCCRALGAAHAKGIVHRDMKPENVFLIERDDNPDFVKLVDFGIAKMNDIETPGEPGRKLTKTGMIFGTPEYMSPEQAAGKPIDHRVDVYAVGVILFELVTGRVPFVGDSFMGILTQHMFEPVPGFAEINPDVIVPLELEAVILKALAKKPEERFQTMEQLLDALQAAQQGRMMDQTMMGFARPIKAPETQGKGLAALRVDEPDAVPSRRTRTTVGAERSSASKVIVPIVLLLAAGGGAAAYFGMKGSGARTATTTVVTPPPPVVEVDAGQPLVAAEPDLGVDAGPSMVELTVDTRPTGAEVSIAGAEARCAPSPCVLTVAAGQSVTLTAVSGNKTGELEVAATQAMTVLIPLENRPAAPRATSGQPRTTTGGARTTGRTSELRVPDIFR